MPADGAACMMRGKPVARHVRCSPNAWQDGRAPCAASHSSFVHLFVCSFIRSLSQVDAAAIDKMHAAYYEEVRRLFEKHREGFAGYERVRLAFSDS